MPFRRECVAAVDARRFAPAGEARFSAREQQSTKPFHCNGPSRPATPARPPRDEGPPGPGQLAGGRPRW
jgi:hypothetical protein